MRSIPSERSGLACLLWLAVCVPAAAQDLRHEVGLRVKPFELQWNRSDAEAKDRALPQVERAVRSFFALDFSTVGKAFDMARLQLEGNPGHARWFDSVSAQPSLRVTTTVSGLSLRLRQFYRTKDPWPPSAQLVVAASGTGNAPDLWKVTLPEPPNDYIARTSWQLSPGDWELTLRVQRGDVVEREWKDIVTVLDDGSKRIVALREQLEALEATTGHSPKHRTLLLTARGLLTRCEGLLRGDVPEVSLGVESALQRTEALIATVASGAEATLGRGDQWWVVSHGPKQSTIRMWLPDPAQRATRPPLVLAVHGVGGSENLFFEGYGAGRVVDLCRERGWILVVPRRPLFGGMPLQHIVEALRPLISFDQARVFVVGHSKGVGETLNAIHGGPKVFRAAGLIGGGGRARESEGTESVRFWVAAGANDFGRSMARRTHEALLGLGSKSEWHLIPHTEHMTVVADALPPLFQFFDQLAKPSPEKRNPRATF